MAKKKEWSILDKSTAVAGTAAAGLGGHALYHAAKSRAESRKAELVGAGAKSKFESAGSRKQEEDPRESL